MKLVILTYGNPSGYFSSMALIGEKVKENDNHIFLKNIIKIGELVEGNKIQIALIPDSFLAPSDKEVPINKSFFVSIRDMDDSKNDQHLKGRYEKVIADIRAKNAGIVLATPEDLKNMENK